MLYTGGMTKLEQITEYKVKHITWLRPVNRLEQR